MWECVNLSASTRTASPTREGEEFEVRLIVNYLPLSSDINYMQCDKQTPGRATFQAIIVK